MYIEKPVQEPDSLPTLYWSIPSAIWATPHQLILITYKRESIVCQHHYMFMFEKVYSKRKVKINKENFVLNNRKEDFTRMGG